MRQGAPRHDAGHDGVLAPRHEAGHDGELDARHDAEKP
jgi:hypothetical protein